MLQGWLKMLEPVEESPPGRRRRGDGHQHRIHVGHPFAHLPLEEDPITEVLDILVAGDGSPLFQADLEFRRIVVPVSLKEVAVVSEEFRLFDDIPAGAHKGEGGREKSDLDDLGACIEKLFPHGGEVLQDLRGGLRLEKLADVTQTGWCAGDPAPVPEGRFRHPGERAGFFLADAGPEDRGVGHRSAVDADMVDGPGIRQNTFVAHRAVGRFKADDSIEGGRPEERATRLGAQGRRTHPVRHRGAGAAA